MSVRPDPGASRSPPPLWSSGFRPFYLAGCLYGLLALGLWAAGQFGGRLALPYDRALWHAHEMIFGFVAALCGGFILTALPSWAGTAAVQGRLLMLLVGAWGLGRAGILAAAQLPPLATALLDMVFVPLLLAVAGRQVWTVANRLYRLLIPILAMLALGNLAFHLGVLRAAPDLAHIGIRTAYYALMVLFSFVGGLLTPIFTESHLRGQAPGPGVVIGFRRPLEALAPAALLVTAATELAGLGNAATGGAALATALIHALRMASWRSGAVLASPMLAAMHAGYAGLILSLGLQAAAALGAAIAPSAAVHAFTIGAMGLTKLSLMTRVALKHTGRDLRLSAVMVAGFAGMGLAALLRVMAGSGAVLAASAMLWAAAIAVYLALYGRFLLAPSLPRGTGP
ncbi:hypothetical protein H261_12271 [Paramagnetospirillum caucaseum]|uniref:NnrS family protein n=1 Tax=Paramagnetospirillum caucaseum TaxID=1244869 RepID=M2Z5U9_9PROT|nr:NnrS family protein [Paramagnetospirillum caucaseum]EME69690.1 hypothetical protein H261_12271 [Paramagnetospirillum caucaseum]